jgi:putative NIF3 family GTP cyclohydrolase 1 type 2
MPKLTSRAVLLEAPERKGYNENKVLLTVDLTKAVAQEAIDNKVSVIVAYRKCFITIRVALKAC